MSEGENESVDDGNPGLERQEAVEEKGQQDGEKQAGGTHRIVLPRRPADEQDDGQKGEMRDAVEEKRAADAAAADADAAEDDVAAERQRQRKAEKAGFGGVATTGAATDQPGGEQQRGGKKLKENQNPDDVTPTMRVEITPEKQLRRSRETGIGGGGGGEGGVATGKRGE